MVAERVKVSYPGFRSFSSTSAGARTVGSEWRQSFEGTEVIIKLVSSTASQVSFAWRILGEKTDNVRTSSRILPLGRTMGHQLLILSNKGTPFPFKTVNLFQRRMKLSASVPGGLSLLPFDSPVRI
jgi:hypothetical protein